MATGVDVGTADTDVQPFNYSLALIVAVVMLTNAASFTLVFPFVGFMVIDVTGCAPEEAGYYAGWLASAIMVGRATSAVPWGWVSDRWGRVPVMVVGNAGISVTALLFGLSRSLGWAIGTRALMGLVSGGLVGTAKVCVGELFHEAHQPQAMGVLGSTWGVGILIGPALGGWLSRPYGRLPGPLGRLGLFAEFPYLLPCLALSALSALSAVVTQFYLPETLPAPGGARKGGQKRGQQYAQLELGAAQDAALPPPAEPHAELAAGPAWYLEGPFLVSMAVYALWSFGALMVDETVALFALASLRFSAVQIGSASAVAGLPLVLFQLLVFPRVVARLGARGALILFGLASAPAVLAIPLSAECEGGCRWGLLLGGLVAKTCLAAAGFTSLFILTNNAVTQAHRGVANGMGTVVSAVAKALGPAVGAPLFAWSITAAGRFYGFGRYYVFALAAALCLLTSALMACSPASLDRRHDAEPSAARPQPLLAEEASKGGAPADGAPATEVWEEVELERRSRA